MNIHKAIAAVGEWEDGQRTQVDNPPMSRPSWRTYRQPSSSPQPSSTTLSLLPFPPAASLRVALSVRAAMLTAAASHYCTRECSGVENSQGRTLSVVNWSIVTIVRVWQFYVWQRATKWGGKCVGVLFNKALWGTQRPVSAHVITDTWICQRRRGLSGTPSTIKCCCIIGDTWMLVASVALQAGWNPWDGSDTWCKSWNI